ncbi:MAG: hypothetical protein KDE50_24565, partial [Caldilineaceae bacterium]|nr:hypothetical protein [Caldilineaceae bacterium]
MRVKICLLTHVRRTPHKSGCCTAVLLGSATRAHRLYLATIRMHIPQLNSILHDLLPALADETV